MGGMAGTTAGMVVAASVAPSVAVAVDTPTESVLHRSRIAAPRAVVLPRGITQAVCPCRVMQEEQVYGQPLAVTDQTSAVAMVGLGAPKLDGKRRRGILRPAWTEMVRAEGLGVQVWGGSRAEAEVDYMARKPLLSLHWRSSLPRMSSSRNSARQCCREPPCPTAKRSALHWPPQPPPRARVMTWALAPPTQMASSSSRDQPRGVPEITLRT